ncbi:glutaredoxin family protein [Aneurinibacillus terranovensis]|uniref:glutaredoxin family protein n=1 Tax=Aneurinibacillus terranovensis TaxID=278991 RepID=UPI000415012E|nr:glutaredoxin family protein [Aneurinibacillus terranovensis]
MLPKQKPFHITIYTRPGCSLCEQVKEKVEKVAKDFPIQLEMFDITRDEAIQKEYHLLIPVVHIDGDKVFVSKMAELWLRRELEARVNERKLEQRVE